MTVTIIDTSAQAQKVSVTRYILDTFDDESNVDWMREQ